MALEGIGEGYNALITNLPVWMQHFMSLFIPAVLIVVYFIFIWKAHKFIAKKNIFNLDLSKYIQLEHTLSRKLLAGVLYMLEYIIILPFIIFFWFAIFTFFLILFTEGTAVGTLLLISAVVISAIRITSYIKEEFAIEVAKLLPLNLLAVAIITSNLFNITNIFNQMSQIPSFLSSILIYLLFIVILESILRLFEFIFSLFELHEEMPEEAE